MIRALPAALTAGACIWLAFLLAAPFASALTFVYDLAGGVCHQRAERSFHLAGAPLPVCARCFGLYLSGAAGAAAAWLAPRGSWFRLRAKRYGGPAGALAAAGDARRARMIFAIAALPTVVTVALEFAGAAHPSNAVRAFASLPLGAAAGWLFVRMLIADAASGDAAGSSAGAVRYHSRQGEDAIDRR